MTKQRAGTGAAGLGMVLVLAVGCGTTADPPGQTQVKPAQTKVAPAKVTADVRACAGAEAILGHVAADTAAWSPAKRPFDRGVARRIRTQAGFLASQGPQASDAGIQVAVGATAASFRGVAGAMQARDRARLDQAIKRSRVAYKALKSACGSAGAGD